MTSRKFIKYIAFVLCILFFGPLLPVRSQDDYNDDGSAEDQPAEQEPEKTCQASLFGLTTNIIPILPKCLFGGNAIDLKLTSIFQALPRIYCVLKCVFAELTVFGPDGMLDEVAALLFFQEAIPEYALPPIVEKAQPCLALATGFKPEQYFCQSYSPFIQCLSGVLVTGIGPFAMECLGTPFFAGLFGLLNFVVPPERATPGEARRQTIGGLGNATIGTNTTVSFGSRSREQRRRNQHAGLGQGNTLPNFAAGGERMYNTTRTSTNNSVVIMSPPTSTPALFHNNHVKNRWRNANTIDTSSKDMNPHPRSGPRRGFSVDFMFTRRNEIDSHKFKNNYSKYIPPYHTNNTDSIVFQLDRITNLAKSLQLLTNNTAKFF